MISSGKLHKIYYSYYFSISYGVKEEIANPISLLSAIIHLPLHSRLIKGFWTLVFTPLFFTFTVVMVFILTSYEFLSIYSINLLHCQFSCQPYKIYQGAEEMNMDAGNHFNHIQETSEKLGYF